MSDKFFLDTNILVYVHDASEPEKQTRSQELIFQAIRTGQGAISPQVLSEFFVTVTRKIQTPVSIKIARREIALLGSICSVDLDFTLILRAVDLKERWQVSYWDAMILAAAERGNCSVVYSEDLSNGQVYGALRVENPYLAF